MARSSGAIPWQKKINDQIFLLAEIETWIWATITQCPLTHLALDHEHKNILDNLDFRNPQYDFNLPKNGAKIFLWAFVVSFT